LKLLVADCISSLYYHLNEFIRQNKHIEFIEYLLRNQMKKNEKDEKIEMNKSSLVRSHNMSDMSHTGNLIHIDNLNTNTDNLHILIQNDLSLSLQSISSFSPSSNLSTSLSLSNLSLDPILSLSILKPFYLPGHSSEQTFIILLNYMAQELKYEHIENVEHNMGGANNMGTSINSMSNIGSNTNISSNIGPNVVPNMNIDAYPFSLQSHSQSFFSNSYLHSFSFSSSKSSKKKKKKKGKNIEKSMKNSEKSAKNIDLDPQNIDFSPSNIDHFSNMDASMDANVDPSLSSYSSLSLSSFSTPSLSTPLSISGITKPCFYLHFQRIYRSLFLFVDPLSIHQDRTERIERLNEKGANKAWREWKKMGGREKERKEKKKKKEQEKEENK
jgi:hypothetical protein